MTDPEILNHLDLLVIEKLKIDSNVFSPTQKVMALEYFKKDLNEIINKDKNYLKIFQQKFNLKSKDYNKTTKSKDTEKREEDKEKQRIIEDSLDPINAAQKIIFYKMQPGKFVLRQAGQDFEINIKKPFSMMSTLFTQMMWARLQIFMGEIEGYKINPSKYKAGADGININFQGINVKMKPDHPVEQVSWNDISEFIKKLNNLSKLDDPETINLLKKLIPDHQKNDVYDLPSYEQWEFVMRDRGKANSKYFDKSDSSDLSKYGWYFEHETQRVAQLMPRMIDGGNGIRQPFFDLEGNVWEWNKRDSDFFSPVRSYRGGSYDSYADYLRSGISNNNLPTFFDSTVGFRLVRTNR